MNEKLKEQIKLQLFAKGISLRKCCQKCGQDYNSANYFLKRAGKSIKNIGKLLEELGLQNVN